MTDEGKGWLNFETKRKYQGVGDETLPDKRID